MSSASGILPRKAISDMIIYTLSQEGKTIEMIESQRNRKYKGDMSQQQYRDKPMWHNRQDLITLVAEKLRIHPTLLGPTRTSNDFEDLIDLEITKIKKKGIIVKWNSTKHFGIWRVVEPIPVNNPIMSTRIGPTVEQTDLYGEENLMKTFVSIITKGSKSNTYKFTLAKILLDHCKNSLDDSSQTHEIHYEKLALQFLKHYWHQEYKFQMKQDFSVNTQPRVITILHDVFGKKPQQPVKFDQLDKNDRKNAQDKILKAVFGHARLNTSYVIPKFQKTRVGQYSDEVKIFYDYDDDKKILYLKPQAFKFFKANYKILSLALLAEWAKYLEKINQTLPRLIAKIERIPIKRTSLTEYQNIFSVHDHCFYCNEKLEVDYTDVDHFIPWSYIFDNNAWNLVLACKKCNCKKSNSLPQEEFRDMLVKRNSKYYETIEKLKLSLDQLDTCDNGWKPEIENHYTNCLKCGFKQINLP